MKYFVTKEWEGPGPVVDFIFHVNGEKVKYYLYIDYMEQIEYLFYDINKKYFIAAESEYMTSDLVKMLKVLYTKQFKSEEPIMREWRYILKEILSKDSNAVLKFEGV
ncbi:hypothetical protein TP70_10525 [Staphylococcus microti]|uniref:Uncharacterized protein n=1 Tax=Staphylococcus microti TaxID=569857 RepID=A0A0D6XNW6_9STAP|nr:hypothetical protein [Staphylococcus microti]KIX89916.1 hypothetical protein TP70_10525 [Staphylococcus microti]PNZ79804.1 hypothetical protein CD132_09200 [Staphylococcus microti]SUM58112.1 Uncharacterised protein [Staphylococcus microti]